MHIKQFQTGNVPPIEKILYLLVSLYCPLSQQAYYLVISAEHGVLQGVPMNRFYLDVFRFVNVPVVQPHESPD